MNVETNLFASIGDQAHIMCILSTGFFLYMVLKSMQQNAHQPTSVFDSAWKETGFCITNQDVPYWSSHDVCLYVDVAFALLSLCVYYALHKTPGMEFANKDFVTGIPAMVFHGIGHGLVAYSWRELDGRGAGTTMTNLEAFRQLSPATAVGNLVLLPTFWYFMLKSALPNMKREWLCLSALLAYTFGQFLSVQLNFTYVQTVLFLAFSVDHLMRPPAAKDFCYMLQPILVSFPLSVVGWMESTMCKSFVMDHLYGHAFYDAYIPASNLVWYGICYMYASQKMGKSKTV